MDKENGVYSYRGIWFSLKIENNPVIHNNMDGPWGPYAEGNKPGSRLTESIYVRNLKVVKLLESRMVTARNRGDREKEVAIQWVQSFSFAGRESSQDLLQSSGHRPNIAILYTCTLCTIKCYRWQGFPGVSLIRPSTHPPQVLLHIPSWNASTTEFSTDCPQVPNHHPTTVPKTALSHLGVLLSSSSLLLPDVLSCADLPKHSLSISPLECRAQRLVLLAAVFPTPGKSLAYSKHLHVC